MIAEIVYHWLFSCSRLQYLSKSESGAAGCSFYAQRVVQFIVSPSWSLELAPCEMSPHGVDAFWPSIIIVNRLLTFLILKKAVSAHTEIVLSGEPCKITTLRLLQKFNVIVVIIVVVIFSCISNIPI